MVSIDLEATGLNTEEARIIEVGLAWLDEHGIVQRWGTLVNPGCPIPAEVQELTGITDEMVAGQPRFEDIAQELLDRITGDKALMPTLVSFNGLNYDYPLLWNEFRRAGISWDYTGVNLVDVCNLDRRLTPHNLSATYKRWTGQELDGAHRASEDAAATLDVLQAMGTSLPLAPSEDPVALAKFSNYDMEVLDISGKFGRDANGRIVFKFGKNQGQPADADHKYLNWMLTADFARDTKAVAKRIISGTLR